MSQPVTTPRGQHWAQINEFSFVAGMRLLFWLCRACRTLAGSIDFVSGFALVLFDQTGGARGVERLLAARRPSMVPG